MNTKSPHPNHDSTQAVILRHTLPDNSSHYDWLIEIPARQDEYRLLTFRSQIRPDQFPPQPAPDRPEHSQLFRAEQLANHRAHYLQFQGNIGDGRGTVARLAVGQCSQFQWADGDQCFWVIHWKTSVGDGEKIQYQGRYLGGGIWNFDSSEFGRAKR